MSTINRGPLGSAFRINLDSNNPNGNGNSAQRSGDPRPTTSGPTLSANGPIPMPGPTSSPTASSATSPTTTATLEPAPAMTMAPPGALPVPPPKGSLVTTDLARSLAEVKGQAQFLLYLADQIEDSLHQLVEEHDACQNAFLCRVLSMYSAQLETKHHGLGDKIAETCQEVYVTVRDYDTT